MSRGWGAALLLLWAAAMTPITILLHELGHFAVALASGLPAQLKPTAVSGGAEAGEAAGWLAALQAAGGPAMTVAMCLAAAALYTRDRRRLWALAAAFAAASRLLVTTGYLGVRLLFAVRGQPFAGTPNFDEHNVAAALGLPTLLTASAATLFLFGLAWWLMRRVERGRRFAYLVAMVAGIVAGGMAWAYLAPSVLLSVT